MEKTDGRERASRRERYFYFYFSSLCFFSDLWKSDHKFSSGLKVKLIHAVRAMCGYQNIGVSSNSTR